MPVITAKREGPCSGEGCPDRIQVGERIDFTHAQGARHLACVERPAIRVNLYRMTCDQCHGWIPKGQARVKVLESPQPDGTFAKAYRATCLDTIACFDRIAARNRGGRR
jgi:hypothetical protein